MPSFTLLKMHGSLFRIIEGFNWNNKSCTIADNIKSHSTITRSILFENSKCAQASELEKMLLRQTLKQKQYRDGSSYIVFMSVAIHHKQATWDYKTTTRFTRQSKLSVYVKRHDNRNKIFRTIFFHMLVFSSLHIAKCLNTFINLSIL